MVSAQLSQAMAAFQSDDQGRSKATAVLPDRLDGCLSASKCVPSDCKHSTDPRNQHIAHDCLCVALRSVAIGAEIPRRHPRYAPSHGYVHPTSVFRARCSRIEQRGPTASMRVFSHQHSLSSFSPSSVVSLLPSSASLVSSTSSIVRLPALLFRANSDFRALTPITPSRSNAGASTTCNFKLGC